MSIGSTDGFVLERGLYFVDTIQVVSTGIPIELESIIE